MAAFTELAPGRYTVDPADCEVGFSLRRMLVGRISGRFSRYTVDVHIGNTRSETFVRARLCAGSVETGNTRRDAHLRSPDFLDCAAYPAITFVSTDVDPLALTGDLTIRDVTRRVIFDLEFLGVAEDLQGRRHAGFEASTTIERRLWGLTWNRTLEGGGLLLGEQVLVVLDVELVADPVSG